MQWEKHIVGIIWFVLIVFSMMASGRKLMRALKIEPLTFSGEVSLSFAFGIPIVYFIIQIIGYAGLLKSWILMDWSFSASSSDTRSFPGISVKSGSAW